MPRKNRIEYPGAMYHVLNRGNYRRDLFVLGRSGEAFEKCLFEVVERCGWRLFAYALMINHYHLAAGNNGVGSVVCSTAEYGPSKPGEQFNQWENI